MKILVTGGAGFIGSHTVDALLRAGHAVTIVDDFNDFYNPEIKRANLAGAAADVEIVEGDIRDANLVEGIFAGGGFDAVIHLAARAGVRPSILEPGLYLATNVNGTFNLLEAARRLFEGLLALAEGEADLLRATRRLAVEG